MSRRRAGGDALRGPWRGVAARTDDRSIFDFVRRSRRFQKFLSNREKLGMDQVFVVWTSKSGLNQMGLVF